jgi:formylglycine-generating enzyme required for sulfatase activity
VSGRSTTTGQLRLDLVFRRSSDNLNFTIAGYPVSPLAPGATASVSSTGTLMANQPLASGTAGTFYVVVMEAVVLQGGTQWLVSSNFLQGQSYTTTSTFHTTCYPNPSNACVNSNRFSISGTFQDYSGNSGPVQMVQMGSDTAWGYFSDSSNTELVVKVLNFCSVSSVWAVYAGGLTDLQINLSVRDTSAGGLKTYTNALGNSWVLIRDGAFSCSGGGGGGGSGSDEVTVPLAGLPASAKPLVLERIPSGTFQMGSPTTERNRGSDETLHQVTLTQDYYMGKNVVTQAQWKAVMGTAMRTDCGSSGGDGDDYPVYCVSWNDIRGASGFIAKLNQLQGTTKFRLPTEAEWERAARGGTQTRFSFGDATSGDDACGANAAADPYVWWCGNDGDNMRLVGTKGANPYGLYDMNGNVSEWVEDWYGDYPSTSQTDPTGVTGGSVRVNRGGSWVSTLDQARSAYRYRYYPDTRNYQLGFRLARSL